MAPCVRRGTQVQSLRLLTNVLLLRILSFEGLSTRGASKYVSSARCWRENPYVQ